MCSRTFLSRISCHCRIGIAHRLASIMPMQHHHFSPWQRRQIVLVEVARSSPRGYVPGAYLVLGTSKHTWTKTHSVGTAMLEVGSPVHDFITVHRSTGSFTSTQSIANFVTVKCAGNTSKRLNVTISEGLHGSLDVLKRDSAFMFD